MHPNIREIISVKEVFSKEFIERVQKDMLGVPYEELGDTAKAKALEWYKEIISVTEYSGEISKFLAPLLKEVCHPDGHIEINADGRAKWHGRLEEWQVTKLARRLLSPRKARYIRYIFLTGAKLSISFRDRHGYYSSEYTSVVEFEGNTGRTRTSLNCVSKIIDEFNREVKRDLDNLQEIMADKVREYIMTVQNDSKLEELLIEKGYLFNQSGKRVESVRQSPRYHVWA